MHKIQVIIMKRVVKREALVGFVKNNSSSYQHITSFLSFLLMNCIIDNEDLRIISMHSAENYIIQTFRNKNIIGLGEGGHHLENAHQFFQKIFENKQIQDIIDIVILEFANTSYQDVLDQYIFGEKVEINELRKVWRESTQSAGLFGESPIYFDLLKKIREVNANLPQAKQIRVLGGDPPIDWSAVNNLEDYGKQIGDSRQTFPAELAIRFGINEGKKVLMIYSEFHLTKVSDKNLEPTYSTITSIVNKMQSDTMKVIGIIYSQTLLSRKAFKNLLQYSAIDLSNDALGNVSATQFFESSLYKNNKEVVLFEGYQLKELFDALIYIDSFNNLQRHPPLPSIDFEKANLIELNRRRKIFGGKPLGDHETK